MGIINGAISFGSNFNIGAKGPIDARMRVETIADLTTAWTTKMPAYKGMAVTVMEDANIYVLNGDDATVAGNWKVIGGDTAADLSHVKTDVAANTAAIKTINGDASTNGSIAKALADAKADATAKDTALKTALVGDDNTEDTIKYAERLANDAADAAATAKSTADAKVAGVMGSTLVDAKVDASKNIVLTDSKALTDAVLKAGTALQEVTGENAITITDKNAISLKTSDKGNVKFTNDEEGLSASVTIPDATVKGVSDGDKVISLGTDGKLSSTISFSVDATADTDGKRYLRLKGIDDTDLGKVDVADFVKDGMLDKAELVTDPEGQPAGTYIKLTWNTDAGKSDPMYINVTSLIDVYIAGNGLNLTDHTFSVDTAKIATKDSVDTLSAKVDGLNVTDNVSAAVAGITVTVNETSGKVSKPVVAVTPGTITKGDTSVVTGGAVYTAVEAAKKAASDALVWNEISNN